VDIEITRDRWVPQRALDPFRLIKRPVDAKRQIRHVSQANSRCNPAPKETACALERRNQLRFVAAAKRHDEHRRLPQIGADAHLCHGDGSPGKRRVTHVVALENVCDRVPQFFSDAELPLA
jgi:hypothetical protein